MADTSNLNPNISTKRSLDDGDTELPSAKLPLNEECQLYLRSCGPVVPDPREAALDRLRRRHPGRCILARSLCRHCNQETSAIMVACFKCKHWLHVECERNNGGYFPRGWRDPRSYWFCSLCRSLVNTQVLSLVNTQVLSTKTP